MNSSDIDTDNSPSREYDMIREPINASKWLRDEDSQEFPDRLSRLTWLANRTSLAEYWTFPGGSLAKALFEEARYCFVYGQFLGTSVLGLAYIERTLAALFYESSRNDLERAGISVLLAEAHACGIFGLEEYKSLDRIRRKRNTYSHFRGPGHEEGVESRSILEDETFHGILEKDATEVMAVVLRMISRNSL